MHCCQGYIVCCFNLVVGPGLTAVCQTRGCLPAVSCQCCAAVMCQQPPSSCYPASWAGRGSKLLYSVILTPSGQSRPCNLLSQVDTETQSDPRHRCPLSTDVTQRSAETKHAQCHKFVSNIFMGLFRGRSIFQVFLLLIIVSGQSGWGG